VLAGQMGGNKELMAGIITATTLAAMVTMPAWILALV
jgi:predicted permease